MNITADEVKRNCSSNQLLDIETNKLLKAIQSEILESSKNGLTQVVVPIPTNFSVPNVSNQTAQTIIYHRLIKEIEKNGFRVRLSMGEGTVTYCIEWDTKKDSKDLKNMRELIASRMIPKSK
jgi:hypothetical protein